MDSIINIYCDESCHLPNDGQKAMVLGAIWCFKAKAAEHNAAIAALKKKHHLSRYFEVKWSKVSPSKIQFYRELVEYFFSAPTIGFRAWIVPDKTILDHAPHNQTHDDWYYKMYFFLIRNLINPKTRYHIYLDIKDTRSIDKLVHLREVLHNANYDFSREIIQNMQHVHSHDIAMLQLCDLLLGAVSYHVRGLHGSPSKDALIELIRVRTGLTLDCGTLPSVRKFNLYFWRPENGGIENA